MNKNEDYRIGRYIIGFYLVMIINVTIKSIFSINSAISTIMSIVIACTLILLIFKSIKIVLRRNGMHFIILEIITLLLFSLSILQGNANKSDLMTNFIWASVVCLPLAIYASSIYSLEDFYNQFLKVTDYMAFILFLIPLFNKNSNYSMSFSYYLLVPALFHMTELLKKFRVKYLLLVIFECLLILVYGARGPLLCIICFILIKFLFEYKNLVAKTIILLILPILLIIFIINFEAIGNFLINKANTIGYQTRTLKIFFSSNFFYLSGRMELWQYYVDLITKSPVIGYGIMGKWIAMGSDPHNAIIEMMLAFGIPVGIGLMVSFVLLQLFSFYKFKGKGKDLLIIYISLNFVLYFVSGDIFKNFNLYILLGICLNKFVERK